MKSVEQWNKANPSCVSFATREKAGDPLRWCRVATRSHFISTKNCLKPSNSVTPSSRLLLRNNDRYLPTIVLHTISSSSSWDTSQHILNRRESLHCDINCRKKAREKWPVHQGHPTPLISSTRYPLKKFWWKLDQKRHYACIASFSWERKETIAGAVFYSIAAWVREFRWTGYNWMSAVNTLN